MEAIKDCIDFVRGADRKAVLFPPLITALINLLLLPGTALAAQTCQEIGELPAEGQVAAERTPGELRQGGLCLPSGVSANEFATFFSLTDHNVYTFPLSKIKRIDRVEENSSFKTEAVLFPEAIAIDPDMKHYAVGKELSDVDPGKLFFTYGEEYHKRWQSTGTLTYLKEKERYKITLKNNQTAIGFLKVDLTLLDTDAVRYSIHQDLPRKNKRMIDNFVLNLNNTEEKKYTISLFLYFNEDLSTDKIIGYIISAKRKKTRGTVKTIEELKNIFPAAIKKLLGNIENNDDLGPDGQEGAECCTSIEFFRQAPL